MKYCHKCLKPWEGPGQPGTRDTCDKCRSDLRACLNCRFYDTARSNQCFANVEDPVLHKDRSNFCEEFSFTERKTPPLAASVKTPQKAKDAFNGLFKKK